ncbi:MAG: Ferric siderophore transport system, periplasmic binding protein TonB [Labilithrix sp.]|jgi:protein TonB|nr:Ferric siderophore transport system, periplasmic binding protein TonB [Labilithrix sp.]
MSSTLNGTTARGPRRNTKRGPGVDPLAGVLSLGPRIPVAVMVAAAVLAVSVHAGAAVGAVQAAVLHAFASWAYDVRATVSNKLAQTYEVDMVKPVEKAEEPPPPPPEEKEPPKQLVKEQPKDEAPPPPPAAADAAKVLMAEPAKDEPVDLTGNTFLAGNADTAIGGVTQIGGKATSATNNLAAVATGVPGGTGAAPAPPAVKVDRSRTAAIVNKANLERCPFPAEADAEQVDEAKVGIEVRVTMDGRAENVAITSDPGHGFGREARKCALREKYVPALNVDGVAIPGVYRVNFRFSR